MKVLFSADHHIKLGTKNIPDEWATKRYNLLFDLLADIETEVDMHVVGGDFLDRVPNMKELELFFRFVSTRKCRTIIFAGNHEAEKKHTTFLSYFKDTVKRLNPLVEIIDDFYTLDNMDFIPYNVLKKYDLRNIDFSGDICFSHFRAEIPPHVKAEVDLKMFERWKVVFAGDLHSHSNSQLNIVYPGSPVTTSFHRTPVDTGVIILDSNSLDWEWVKLEVPQLIRKTIEAGEPMPATDYDHTIYEVTGDMEELGNVENNDLLDKKITKRTTECALVLSPEMAVIDELAEYLRYILMLPEDTVTQCLKEFKDSTK